MISIGLNGIRFETQTYEKVGTFISRVKLATLKRLNDRFFLSELPIPVQTSYAMNISIIQKHSKIKFF